MDLAAVPGQWRHQLPAHLLPAVSRSAQFLYSYATKSGDGLLHTTSNAHETQWDVPDLATTIAAMQALFPAEIQSAALARRTCRRAGTWPAR